MDGDQENNQRAQKENGGIFMSHTCKIIRLTCICKLQISLDDLTFLWVK